MYHYYLQLRKSHSIQYFPQVYELKSIKHFLKYNLFLQNDVITYKLL